MQGKSWARIKKMLNPGFKETQTSFDEGNRMKNNNHSWGIWALHFTMLSSLHECKLVRIK